jgi:hypothetical protein
MAARLKNIFSIHIELNWTEITDSVTIKRINFFLSLGILRHFLVVCSIMRVFCNSIGLLLFLCFWLLRSSYWLIFVYGSSVPSLSLISLTDVLGFYGTIGVVPLEPAFDWLSLALLIHWGYTNISMNHLLGQYWDIFFFSADNQNSLVDGSISYERRFGVCDMRWSGFIFYLNLAHGGQKPSIQVPFNISHKISTLADSLWL